MIGVLPRGLLANRPWAFDAALDAQARALEFTRAERQSVLRITVQDDEVPARLPKAFDAIEQGRDFCQHFFTWYNMEHRHSGIGWHTPASVHYGTAEEVRQQRAVTLDAAFQSHPERFVSKPPTPPQLPTTTWINKPEEETATNT